MWHSKNRLPKNGTCWFSLHIVIEHFCSEKFQKTKKKSFRASTCLVNFSFRHFLPPAFITIGHCPMKYFMLLSSLIALRHHIKTSIFSREKQLNVIKMSISSLTSPPEKSSRRVRFSLPEAKLTLYTDKRTLHGTSKYVNGTLINVTSTIHSANELSKSSSKNEINGAFKSSPNIRPTSVAVTREQSRQSLPNTAAPGIVSRRRHSKTITRSGEKSFNTLPIIERKSSSLEEFEEDSADGDSENKAKSKASTNLTRYKSSDDLRDPSNFKVKSSVLKLPEASNGSVSLPQKKSPTSNTLKVPDYSDTISEIISFSTQTVLPFPP